MSSSVKQRESNIELLRLLAMVLVVALHVNGLSLGYPTVKEYDSNHISVFFKLLFDSLSVVCVDVFVLISGWFGINPNKKRFLSFIYQCLFFSLGLYFVISLFSGSTIKPNLLFRNIILVDYWYVPSYIGLYLLSPVLNIFVENSTQKQFGCIVVGLFFLETLYGWKFEVAGFNSGYSIVHFLLLYLIARYIRIYSFRLKKIPIACDFLLYLILSVFSAVLGLLFLKHGSDNYVFIFADHSSPITILASIFLFLAFSKIKLNNSKVLNYLASSAFSIYLFHLHPMVLPKFMEMSRTLYFNNDLLHYSYKILLFILSISILSILIDQLRKFTWKILQSVKK